MASSSGSYANSPLAIRAPWTDEEVHLLNLVQISTLTHPFTCPRRTHILHNEYNGELGLLLATNDGWVCRDCSYTQDWAHKKWVDPVFARQLRQF